MRDTPNTLFLRLEGPLQAWGDNSKFVIRRTMDAPTKSGVMGLICCAMGLSRHAARERLTELNTLAMGVRVDRQGTRWWDYHTVGAGYGVLTAEGKIKRTATTGEIETLVSRREYLCDVSFLVALQGDSALIEKVAQALQRPRWTLYLGRKSCPPAIPILVMRKCRGDNCIAGEWEPLTERHDNVRSALASESVPWSPRLDSEKREGKKMKLSCLIEWQLRNGETAPADAEVWYDTPVSFDPPVHEPRLIVRDTVAVRVGEAMQQHTLPPPRPQAKYSSHIWTDEIRPQRLKRDQGLCVFCKQQANQVHHASYRHAGGDESVEHDLRSLCRLCHDAVTMIEYGLGMGLDRIDPADPRWRDIIIAKRDEIRRWRSEEARRRALRRAPEKVRREVLEEYED